MTKPLNRITYTLWISVHSPWITTTDPTINGLLIFPIFCAYSTVMRPVMVCPARSPPSWGRSVWRTLPCRSVDQSRGSLPMASSTPWTTLLMRTVSSPREIICPRLKLGVSSNRRPTWNSNTLLYTTLSTPPSQYPYPTLIPTNPHSVPIPYSLSLRTSDGTKRNAIVTD